MPRGFLLDTNVLSETRRPRPEQKVLDFLAAIDPSQLFVSVLTMGELRKGIEIRRRTDEAAANSLAGWVDTIEQDFLERILPINAAVARRWGQLAATTRTLPAIDGLLAATALEADLQLATRNTGDFLRTGVRLLNPWE